MRALDFAQTKISARRSIWSYNKVRVFVAAIIRGRKLFMNLKTEGLILDVGCGPNINPKNINLDYKWCPEIDICCDITKGLPLEDEYVGGIYTEHCIEHISFDDALFVFGEFYRVMKRGSYARIIVPDLEIYVDRYNLFRQRGDISMPYAGDDARKDGIYSPAMSVNRIFRDHGHQFIYDFPTVAAMLEKTGFVNIQKVGFGSSADKSLILDSQDRAIESLYVEAQKP